MITSMAVNAMFKQSLNILLTMVNNLQLVLHMPILSNVIPANAMSFLSAIIPVVMFDVLEEYRIP